MPYELQQPAGRAFARLDDFAVESPFQETVAVAEIKLRLDRFAAMAFEAAFLEKRPDARFEQSQSLSHFRCVIRPKRLLLPERHLTYCQ
jgi:hypothetical protein